MLYSLHEWGHGLIYRVCGFMPFKIHNTQTYRIFRHYFLFSMDPLLLAVLCTSGVPAFFFTCMLADALITEIMQ